MIRSVPKTIFVIASVLFGTKAALAAADPTDTLQPVISETLAYDDNLFRLSDKLDPGLFSDSPERWDFINRVSAGLKSYHPIGRQELSAEGNFAYDSYTNHQILDNISSDATGKWKWQVGNNWNGVMSYGYKRYMGGFTNTNFFGKDMISNQNALFDMNYWFHPSWRVNGQYFRLDSQHSARQRDFLALTQNTGIAGLYYQTTQDNYIGLRYRHAEGVLPNRQPFLFLMIYKGIRFPKKALPIPPGCTCCGKAGSRAVGWFCPYSRCSSEPPPSRAGRGELVFVEPLSAQLVQGCRRGQPGI